MFKQPLPNTAYSESTRPLEIKKIILALFYSINTEYLWKNIYENFDPPPSPHGICQFNLTVSLI